MPAKYHVSHYRVQGTNAPVEINDDAGTLKLGGVAYGWRPNYDVAAPEVTRRYYAHFKNRRVGLFVTFARGVRNILIRKIVAGKVEEHAVFVNHIKDEQVVFPSVSQRVVINKKV